MNEFVKMTIDSYLSVFDAYSINDESLLEEIEQFKKEMNGLGQELNDPGEFSNRLTSSGLMGKYSSLMSRAVAPPKEETKNVQTKIPTVKEFLDQYRISYNEIVKTGYRKRAKAAYENVFNVAERTDDMLDAQIILEKERLLWKIVSEDMLDIYETILEAMDPLSRNTTLPIKLQLQVWNKADSDEEASYLIELSEKEKNIRLEIENFKMTMALILSDLLMSYNSAKIEFRMWGSGGGLAKSGLMKMIILRENTRKAYKILCDKFNLDFDTIINDEWLMHWMLVPSNLDEMGRIKMSLDPYNIEVYRELLFEEILSDSPIEEILLREQKKMLRYALDKRSDQVTKDYTSKAEILNKDIVFFQYKDKLKQYSRV